VRKILFLVVMLFSCSAYCGGWLTQEGIIGSVNVEGGRIRITYSANDLADPDNCGKSDVAILMDDTKTGDRQFALLLAAKMADKKSDSMVAGVLKVGVKHGQRYMRYI
jgi:hypothetical protein